MIPQVELEVFVRAASAGSLSQAGRELGLAPAAASAALKRLEARLGVRLMVRSTRSLRLTPAGETYLAYCRQALEALEEGRRALDAGAGTVRGSLRVAAPSDFGRHALRRWLDEFQGQYPQTQVMLVVSDNLADLFREPIDLALRLGQLQDSSLVARPLLPDNRRVLCAAPDYFTRRGWPRHPLDLAQHNCLCFQVEGRAYDHWRFERGGETAEVQVAGDRRSNDGELVRRWAREGHGVVYKSFIDVAEDLTRGRLQSALDDWRSEPVPLQLVYPHRRHLAPAVQALGAFLERRCHEEFASPQA